MNPPASPKDHPVLLDSLSELHGALLTYTHLHCQAETAPDTAMPQLWVELQKTCLLRIFCANDVLSDQERPEVSSIYYFVMRCPLTLPETAHAEMQRLLDVLNNLLPLGALELQQKDQALFFRYLLLTEESVLDGLLGLDIVLALQTFLPPVMDWLQAVMHQAPLQDALSQQSLRAQFQALLTHLQTPVQPVKAPTLPAPARRAVSPLQHSVRWSLGLSLGVVALLGWFSQSLSLGCFAGGLTILGGCFLGLRRQQAADAARQDHQKNQQKQFFWHLLEVETIKLAYQDHALERHRYEVHQKLKQLGQTPVDYPSDLVRLRDQMRFLKQLQAHLLDRAHQLKLQRQELEDNRFEMLKTHLFQRHNTPLTEALHTGTAAEDLLMQNLVLTLSYLDFQVQVSPSENTSQALILTYLRPQLPPICLSWQRQWHAEPGPRHSWMLSFDCTLPLTRQLSRSELQALLAVFRRFLPLGSLLLDKHRSALCLRYRFVRLRGDLSAMLVMEILEVLASFAERLQTHLQACQQGDKDLSTLLQEAQAAFQAPA